WAPKWRPQQSLRHQWQAPLRLAPGDDRPRALMRRVRDHELAHEISHPDGEDLESRREVGVELHRVRPRSRRPVKRYQAATSRSIVNDHLPVTPADDEPHRAAALR